MHKQIRIPLILLIFASFILSTCSDSDPVRSLKVRFLNAWIENFSDQDSDQYGTFAELHFEIESNQPATLMALVGFRNSNNTSDPSYYVYKQTEAFDLDGTDILYTTLGAESEEIAEGCYDFMIQIFDIDDTEKVLAQINAENTSNIAGICFEDVTQDQIVQFEVSNPLYTTIDVTVNSSQTKSVEPGGSTIFEFNGNPGVIDVYGETMGKTDTGSQIGLLMFWDFSVDLSGMVYDGWELSLGSEYFFLYITNNGSVNLTPLYVNYDRAEETVDNILLRNDNVKYSTGYYRAFSNTVIAAVIDGTQNAVFWEEANQHFIPWEANQSVHLLNTFAGIMQLNHEEVAEAPGLAAQTLKTQQRRLWEKGKRPRKVFAKPLLN